MLIEEGPLQQHVGVHHMSDTFRLPRVGTVDEPLRLAVLISGSGSGMEALLRHQAAARLAGGCYHQTAVVISNVADVRGLARATEHGIPAEVITLPAGDNPSERRVAHEQTLHTRLCEWGIDAVILSGYMRILTNGFVSKWEGRLLNIHPSLLPDFPGAHAHRDVLEAGVDTTGCTVHFVDMGVDSGTIIALRAVPVEPEDDEDSLSERVKQAEHRLYPMVIDAFCEGRLQITNGQVEIV